MHARKKIRYGVAALCGALPTIGPRVYPSRVFSLDASELPSLSIFTKQEPVSTNAPAITLRKLLLVIEGHAVADDSVDDMLDQIAFEVEGAMARELVVDGKQLTTQLQDTETDVMGEGDVQVGLVRLTYLIPYATRRNTPDSLAT